MEKHESKKNGRWPSRSPRKRPKRGALPAFESVGFWLKLTLLLLEISVILAGIGTHVGRIDGRDPVNGTGTVVYYAEAVS